MFNVLIKIRNKKISRVNDVQLLAFLFLIFLRDKTGVYANEMTMKGAKGSHNEKFMCRHEFKCK